MRRALFGIESEYALTGFRRGGVALPLPWLVKRFEAAAARLPHLPGNESGVFLRNGGRLYIDADGYHPEHASPETTDPWNAVRYAAAGDRLVAQVVDRLLLAEPIVEHVIVRKGNVDYAGATTWASHENYLHSADPQVLQRALVPHLVSRIIFTGAGGFDPRDRERLPFVLSPRAVFLSRVIGLHTADRRGNVVVRARRALVDTRAQPHCEGHHRQHLICGDALNSHLGQFLRIGTTALVVALADAGCLDTSEISMNRPLTALAVINADVSLRRTITLASGRQATVIDIQRRLLAQSRSNLDRLPEWADAVCEVWQNTLDLLSRGPDAVSDRLDWAIKWAVFQHRAQRIENSNPAGSNVPAQGGPRARPLDKTELCEVDLRFGQVHPPGLFQALDEAGVLRHGVPGIDRIDEAMVTPPPTGRAAVRGRVVARLAERAYEFLCGWDAITQRDSALQLDLSDPFVEREQWHQPAASAVDTTPAMNAAPGGDNPVPP